MINTDETVRKYYSDIYKFCCSRCRNADDAQDITQDVFVVLVEKSATLNDKNIRAWLYQTADNKLHEYLRKKTVKNTFISLDENVCGYPNLSVQQDITLNLVQKKILNLLNDSEKELFIKLYIENNDVELISEELGISKGALRVRKSRLKAKIKKSYKFTETLILILGYKIFS